MRLFYQNAIYPVVPPVLYFSSFYLLHTSHRSIYCMDRSEGTKAQRLVDAREGLLLLQRMPSAC